MSILQSILGYLARKIIHKYKPFIIAVTGSAGKTSAKEAIFAALKNIYSVKATLKNYNNELGLPLTIIGGTAAGKNIFKWLMIIIRGWLRGVYSNHFPKMLILEMGADHPGDLQKLTDIAPPIVSVITSVGTAHMEFYGSREAIAEEKETLVRVLPADGCAVLNADDPRVAAMRAAAKSKVITYGFGESADVRAKKIEYVRDSLTGLVQGMRVTAQSGSFNASFELQGVIGEGHVRAALSALSVAKAIGAPLADAALGLSGYRPAPGRMCLISGIKGTVLIDDSYNSSPGPALDAIAILEHYPVAEGARRIVLMGDMLELGSFTEQAHAQLGERTVKSHANLFIGVGERMHDALEAAKAAGMHEDHVIHMENAVSAAKFLQERIKAGDVILIKGSQGMRMERAVLELMTDPLRAGELLCRQGKEWE